MEEHASGLAELPDVEEHASDLAEELSVCGGV
jgi:hypothetical protein